MIRRNRFGFAVLPPVSALVVFFGVAVFPVSTWQWPTPAVERLDPQASVGPPGSVEQNLHFQFGSVEGATIPVTAPVTGEVLFADRAPGPAGDRFVLVVRDEHEFWVHLELTGATLAFADGVVPRTIVAGTPIGAARRISIGVFDHLRERYVHPRALFPFTSDLPADGMPPLAVVQDQREFTGRTVTLRPGRFQLIIPAESATAAVLPAQLYILRDGLLEADHSFVTAPEVAALRDDDGNIVVLESEVRPGSTIVEIGARLFNGSVEQRTVRLEAVSQLLDTP